MGTDNIKTDKRGKIFIGNHMNKIDPVVMALAIENPVHWAALQRMFQRKENIFNLSKNPIQCCLSAVFISILGAIPIARTTDKDYQKINLKAIKDITQYLCLGGSIGIFPEGTINRKPEEQNIHPLKSNRAFRIAIENNAWVQPIQIVWIPKNFGIKNKVFLNFSEPVDTTSMNAIDLKNLWLKTTESNIEKMNIILKEINQIDQINILERLSKMVKPNT